MTIHARPPTLFVTGATGFVGRGVIQALGAPEGQLRLLVRSPKTAPAGIDVVVGDVTNPESLLGAMAGIETVVHLVGIIEEKSGATFDSVIRQGTEHVVAEAQRAGVRHFILMSAQGAQDSERYPYHQAKFRAEQAVIASGIPYTIFRPSVIFGAGDGFISVLAKVVRQFPLIPVVGSGNAMFQPAQVNDVGAAFAYAVANPDQVRDQVIELGGGMAYSYEQMLDVIARELGVSKRKVHLPLSLMKPVVQGSAMLPRRLRPPVTSEQLKMLALDNRTPISRTAELIGHKPVTLEEGIGYIRRT